MATINGKEYSKASSAINEAKSGDTVKFTSEELNGSLTVENKNIVLDGITIKNSDDSALYIKNSVVTIKNGSVSAMAVNNETGAIHDMYNIVKLARELAPDASVHFDAVQAFCKFPLERFPGADLISVSSHKIYGPKGMGALYISERILKNGNISPVIFGGGQEQGLRSGTENVIGIIGFGAAAKETGADIRANAQYFTALRSYLCEKLADFPENTVKINEPAVFAPHIVSITVSGIRSETMLHHLSSRGVYVSSGSACSSNTHHKSNALSSFGLSDSEADSTIRISFGLQNTRDDVDNFISALSEGISRLAKKR